MNNKYALGLKYILLLLLLSIDSTAQSNIRPNIVFFIADDVGWNDLGCYGNRAVATPHIDQLAITGVQFQNAFLTASSCSPSRISILNGRYPHNTGAAELHMPILASLPNLAMELKKAGYFTVSAGKWHQGNTMKPCFDLIYSQKDGDGGNGDGGENNWVRSIAERPKEKPFFMWFAAHDAHRIWGANEYSTTNRPEKVVVPPYMVDSEVTRQDFAQYHDEITRFDAFVGKVMDYLKESALLQNTLIVVMADNGRPFPRCKTRLYDDGIKTPLLIRWDGGKFAKNQKTTAMVSAIDIMPTLLEAANLSIPETVQGKSFLNILKNPSLEFRTFAFAEHNWHDYEAYERMVRTKDFLYIYNARPQYPQSTSGDNHRDSSFQELVKVWRKGELSHLQMDNFKAPRNFEELYDLNNDPQQLYDVSKDPTYKIKLLEMRALKNEWQTQTADTEPTKLTPSNHDWLMGTFYDETFVPTKRGEMPGASKKAHLINHPGRF
ncbi:MAG: sulfatase [Spirosomataceae bacterium]